MQHSSQRWFGALGVSAIYAALDEFHQSFVASRTGTAWDVLIDCIGAAIGLALFHAFSRRRNRDSKMTASGK
jgi:VanZ family protein